MAGVLAVHGLLALAYVFGGPVFVRTAQQNVAVIDIPPELPKEVEPPPPPKFLPPEVYVPVPIVPLITLAEPPPTLKAITLPPPRETPAAPTAPLVQAVPFDGDARDAYVAALFKHLNKYKRYPQSAKLRHEQGVVSLRFTIDGDGHVLAASLAKSSGSEALDKEVLAAVRRADPLPRIPDIFNRDRLDLVVPVEFVLR
jgi:protein TonB